MMNQRSQDRGRLVRLLTALAMALALIAVAVPRTASAQEATGAPRTITLNELTDNPSAYAGQRVTVRGDLVEVFGSGAFRLDDETAFGGDSALVFGADRNLQTFEGDGPWDAAIGSNVNMQVTGIVRVIDPAFEDELGYDIDDGLYDAYNYNGLYDTYEGQAAIIATNTEVLATLSDVADNTDAYVGLPVTVYGDIVDIVSPTAFQLDDPALLGFDTLLVVGANEDVLPTGDNFFDPGTFDALGVTDIGALVHGTVRANDLDAIQEDTSYDLDENVFRDYAEDGVLVADVVRPDITLSDIADNPGTFDGLRVSIVGDVIDRVGVDAFQLDDEALLGFDTLLVVTREGVPVPVSDDVRVNGIVETFDRVLVEDEVGYDLVEGDFDTFEGRPVVIASSVMAIDDTP